MFGDAKYARYAAGLTNSYVVAIAIGVDAEGKPVGSILEAAKLGGFKTGLVVTSTINHATPACMFYNTCSGSSEEDGEPC